MKRKLYPYVGIFLVIAFLCGCSRKTVSAPPLCRVVTRITVTTPDHQVHTYSDPRELQKMLTYLRVLRPSYLIPDDSGAMDGEEYRITLERSDGTQRICSQKGSRYFYAQGDAWRKINPEKGMSLKLLLAAMPGDLSV